MHQLSIAQVKDGPGDMRVLARRVAPIWPKANILPRDYIKEERFVRIYIST